MKTKIMKAIILTLSITAFGASAESEINCSPQSVVGAERKYQEVKDAFLDFREQFKTITASLIDASEYGRAYGNRCKDISKAQGGTEKMLMISSDLRHSERGTDDPRFPNNHLPRLQLLDRKLRALSSLCQDRRIREGKLKRLSRVLVSEQVKPLVGIVYKASTRDNLSFGGYVAHFKNKAESHIQTCEERFSRTRSWEDSSSCGGSTTDNADRTGDVFNGEHPYGRKPAYFRRTYGGGTNFGSRSISK